MIEQLSSMSTDELPGVKRIGVTPEAIERFGHLVKGAEVMSKSQQSHLRQAAEGVGELSEQPSLLVGVVTDAVGLSRVISSREQKVRQSSREFAESDDIAGPDSMIAMSVEGKYTKAKYFCQVSLAGNLATDLGADIQSHTRR